MFKKYFIYRFYRVVNCHKYQEIKYEQQQQQYEQQQQQQQQQQNVSLSIL